MKTLEKVFILILDLFDKGYRLSTKDYVCASGAQKMGQAPEALVWKEDGCYSMFMVLLPAFTFSYITTIHLELPAVKICY